MADFDTNLRGTDWSDRRNWMTYGECAGCSHT